MTWIKQHSCDTYCFLSCQRLGVCYKYLRVEIYGYPKEPMETTILICLISARELILTKIKLANKSTNTDSQTYTICDDQESHHNTLLKELHSNKKYKTNFYHNLCKNMILFIEEQNNTIMVLSKHLETELKDAVEKDNKLENLLFFYNEMICEMGYLGDFVSNYKNIL